MQQYAPSLAGMTYSMQQSHPITVNSTKSHIFTTDAQQRGIFIKTVDVIYHYMILSLFSYLRPLA